MNNRRRYSIVVLAASMAAILFLLGLAAPSRAQQQESPGFEQTEPALSGDLAAPTTAGSLELLAQVGGEITSVVSDGEYLYAGSGPRLLILTLEANPQVVGRSELFPDTITGVAVTGETAVIATKPTLYTLDVSDPTHPVVLGQLQLTYVDPWVGPPVLAAGDFAYVISDNSIDIVDISDPAHPQLRAIFSGTQTEIDSATIQGNLMLLAERSFYCGKFGCSPTEYYLLLVDVSDPVNPQTLVEVPMDDYVWNLELDGNLAYIRIGDLIRVLDVTEPAQPVTLGTLVGLSNSSINSFVVSEGVAYLVTDRELQLFDLSIPTEPAFLGKVVLPQGARGLGLTLAGNTLGIKTSCDLRMVDVADPTHPLLLGTYATIQASEALVSEGELLYAAGGSCLQVLDVSEPRTPVLLGYLYFRLHVSGLYLEDGLLYAFSDDGLAIIDVTEPASPVLLNTIVFVEMDPDCYSFSFVVAGGYAYGDCFDDVFNPYPSVPILDIRSPWAPRWADQYDFPDPDRAFHIAATPGVLYVMAQYHPIDADDPSLYLVDVHEPWEPELLATVSGINRYAHLGYAWVDLPNLYMLTYNYYPTDDADVLSRIDVSNPSSPRITATVSGVPRDPFFPSGDYVYFVSASWLHTLTVYTEPPATAYPFLATIPCTACSIQLRAVAADQDALFLGQDDGSLWVYRFTPPAVTGTFLPIVGK